MFLLQASTTALFDVAELNLIAPEFTLTVCACVALEMSVLVPHDESRWTGYFALLDLALAALSVYVMGWPMLSGVDTTAMIGFYNTVKFDGFADVFKLFF